MKSMPDVRFDVEIQMVPILLQHTCCADTKLYTAMQAKTAAELVCMNFLIKFFIVFTII